MYNDSVCTGTLRQNRGRKHSEDSRTLKESLITKSMTNSRSLDRIYLTTDPCISLTHLVIFLFLLRLKLYFDKMNIACLCLGNTATSEFYTPTFQDTFRCRGITQKEAYNIEKTAEV